MVINVIIQIFVFTLATLKTVTHTEKHAFTLRVDGVW